MTQPPLDTAAGSLNHSAIVDVLSVLYQGCVVGQLFSLQFSMSCRSVLSY